MAIDGSNSSVSRPGQGDAPRRLLIILLGAIGDVTRALPLAVRIRKHWPTTEINWAVEPKSMGILENHPAIDRIVLFDRPKGLGAYLKFVGELRSLRCDLTIDLQRHFKSGLTSLIAGSKRRLGFHRRNAKEFNWLFNNEHIKAVNNWSSKLEHYQLFGDLLGLPSATKADHSLTCGLTPTTEESNKITKLIADEATQLKMGSAPGAQEFFACILGSSWSSRLWPVEHWVSLIAQLKEQYRLYPLLVGGPAERNLADQILARAPGVVFDLVGKTSLRELVAVFSQVAFGVGCDSGPMHICAGVGRPVISLWGATSPLRSAPYGSNHLVLQSPIACSPCYQRECPGLDRLCMRTLPPEAVVARLTAGLGE